MIWRVTVFASPTIGRSTLTLLFTLDGSMSTWIFFALRREALDGLPGDAIVEARADVDDEVGLGHRDVRRVRAVHAEHAEATAGAPAGTQPSAMSVGVTGRLSRSASSRISARRPR